MCERRIDRIKEALLALLCVVTLAYLYPCDPFYLYLLASFYFLFQFTGFVSVCLTARRMRYEINLYPGFVVFPAP